MLKYSRQREAIKNFLMTRHDHPTADVVYSSVRTEFPNISLGTVYRNLTLLADLGEIARLRVGDGVDHFGADTHRHYHFVCHACSSLTDLETAGIDHVLEAASRHFDCLVQGHVTYFYGLCPHCMQKAQKSS